MKKLEIDSNTILGSGGFAIVYRGFLVDDSARRLAKRRRIDGSCHLEDAGTNNSKSIQVAVKRIQLAHIKCRDGEETALRQLDHPNIMKLFHVENDEHFRYYALEICSASLDQLFLRENHPKKYKGPPLPSHLTVLRQLASGLEYIHLKKLVHRDIKPHNILIHVSSESGGGNATPPVVSVKWANFRLSKAVNERGTYTISGTRSSTFSWMAPELLRTLVLEASQHSWSTAAASDNDGGPRGTVKSDVFATGCVFVYFLLDGIHPYGFNQMDIPLNIKNNEPTNFTKLESSSHNYAVDFIRQMLNENPQDRLSSSQVVARLHEIASSADTNK